MDTWLQADIIAAVRGGDSVTLRLAGGHAITVEMRTGDVIAGCSCNADDVLTVDEATPEQRAEWVGRHRHNETQT